jgi:hypothetical protein
MTPQEERHALLRLIRTASDRQPMPSQGHFLDDEELVACWESGLHPRLVLEPLARCFHEIDHPSPPAVSAQTSNAA